MKFNSVETNLSPRKPDYNNEPEITTNAIPFVTIDVSAVVFRVKFGFY